MLGHKLQAKIERRLVDQESGVILVMVFINHISCVNLITN
jgi:hypothetical protein